MDHPLLAPAVLPITIDAVERRHRALNEELRHADDTNYYYIWLKLSHVDHLYRALTVGFNYDYTMTKRTIETMERIVEEAGL